MLIQDGGKSFSIYMENASINKTSVGIFRNFSMEELSGFIFGILWYCKDYSRQWYCKKN